MGNERNNSECNSNGANTSGTTDLIDKTLSILQEFYIEFFGTLLPGLVAIGCLSALAGGLYFLLVRDWAKLHAVLLPLEWCPTLATMFLLFVAYMSGAIAYRREPKGPDAVSSMRQWRQTKGREKRRLSVQFIGVWKPQNWRERIWSWLNYSRWIRDLANKKKVDIDFPYPQLRKFLMTRHLFDLAKYVSWCKAASLDEPPENWDKLGKESCSKHFINTFKHCIRISGRASLISDMTRNECHIRMLCSFWYILTFVLYVTMVCILAGIVVGCCKWFGVERFNDIIGFAVYLISHAVWFFLVWYCRRNIEKGLHYVRTREVVMILEAANILETVDAEVYGELFRNIRDDAKRFHEVACVNCKDEMCKRSWTCQNQLSSAAKAPEGH